MSKQKSKEENVVREPEDIKVDELEKKYGCRACAAEEVFHGKSDLHTCELKKSPPKKKVI